MLIASKPFHRIASSDSSLFKDGKVEATPTALLEISQVKRLQALRYIA
jgi:hypothetical protein